MGNIGSATDMAIFWVELSDEEILEPLVALNHQGAEEEQRGIIRYLRPEFQNPQGQSQKQIGSTAKFPP